MAGSEDPGAEEAGGSEGAPVEYGGRGGALGQTRAALAPVLVGLVAQQADLQAGAEALEGEQAVGRRHLVQALQDALGQAREALLAPEGLQVCGDGRRVRLINREQRAPQHSQRKKVGQDGAGVGWEGGQPHTTPQQQQTGGRRARESSRVLPVSLTYPHLVSSITSKSVFMAATNCFGRPSRAADFDDAIFGAPFERPPNKPQRHLTQVLAVGPGPAARHSALPQALGLVLSFLL